MIVKIRVQCLPEHGEQVKKSLQDSFMILEESKQHPNRNSKFIRIYFDCLLKELIPHEEQQLVHTTSK